MLDSKDGSWHHKMHIENNYIQLIEALKQEIQQARMRAHVSVNRELIILYWKIGKKILQRQSAEGWGSKVIENVSQDLRKAFPEMKGLSSQNLFYMRQFAMAYPGSKILQQAVGGIPWGHNIAIFSKVKEPKQQPFRFNLSLG